MECKHCPLSLYCLSSNIHSVSLCTICHRAQMHIQTRTGYTRVYVVSCQRHCWTEEMEFCFNRKIEESILKGDIVTTPASRGSIERTRRIRSMYPYGSYMLTGCVCCDNIWLRDFPATAFIDLDKDSLIIVRVDSAMP